MTLALDQVVKVGGGGGVFFASLYGLFGNWLLVYITTLRCRFLHNIIILYLIPYGLPQTLPLYRPT
jgi:hypothetical protein